MELRAPSPWRRGVTNAHTARMLEMAGKIMEVVQRQTGGDLECMANGYEEDDHA